MIDDLTVIIITYQEESNIKDCIVSAQSVTNNIFVVDSHSTDKTQLILSEMGIRFTEHEFVSYAEKRNWAQKNNPFKTEWVLHLDADERLTPELSDWLLNKFQNEKNKADGFMFSRKTIFLEKWIKHGGQYPNFHLRLFKENIGSCENKAYDQHFVLTSHNITSIKYADIINIEAPNLEDFTLSHIKWAAKEANEIVSIKNKYPGEVRPKILGNPIERRRWLKLHIFQKSPLFLRSFIYFIYRYFIRLGFLDGKQGLIFFVLQTFWFRFLIDAKVFELTKNQEGRND